MQTVWQTLKFLIECRPGLKVAEEKDYEVMKKKLNLAVPLKVKQGGDLVTLPSSGIDAL